MKSTKALLCFLHQHYIKKKDNSTGFANHCITNYHNLDLDNIWLLHCENKEKVLTYLENLEIKRAKKHNTNLVNNQLDIHNLQNPALGHKTIRNRDTPINTGILGQNMYISTRGLILDQMTLFVLCAYIKENLVKELQQRYLRIL